MFVSKEMACLVIKTRVWIQADKKTYHKYYLASDNSNISQYLFAVFIFFIHLSLKSLHYLKVRRGQICLKDKCERFSANYKD